MTLMHPRARKPVLGYLSFINIANPFLLLGIKLGNSHPHPNLLPSELGPRDSMH